MHSYFSLNRQPIRLDLPAEVDHSAAEPETFVGARPSEWLPPQLEGIVVDDLDPGFAVEGDPPGRGIWHRFSPELSYDRGLPEHWWYLEGTLDGAWFRAEVPSSWGKYRRTMAQAVPGDGNRRAVFTADLPTRAGWRLDFHVPDDPLPDFPGDTFADFVDPPFTDQLGGYDMWLRTVSGDRVIEFDGSGAIPGWHKIGLFELDPGPCSERRWR